MIMRTVSVKAEAISLSTETRPLAGSVKAKIVSGTSKIVTVAALR